MTEGISHPGLTTEILRWRILIFFFRSDLKDQEDPQEDARLL